MSKYSNYHIVSACLDKIEKMLNWGPSSEWHNSSFEELSNLINEKTGVLLSSTTLKRVWGRIDYKSAPSISTLDALSQYAGYENWRSFKIENTQDRKHTPSLKDIKKQRYTTPILILVLVVIGILLTFSLRTNSNTSIDTSKISFSSKPVSTGLPNSVIFDLDLQDIQSDSMYIQQYWDPSKTIKLKNGQKQATGIYYYPGYFRAKLLIDGQLVKEHPLFIHSDGWLTTIDYEPIPKYYSNNKNTESGLELDSSAMNDIKASEKVLSSTYALVDDLRHISADSFTLNARIQHTFNDRWAVCQALRVIILGDKSAAVIPFSLSGCVSDISLMLSDVYISGKEKDLSALGIDLNEAKDIELITADHELTVRVDESEIMRLKYNKDIGRLVGLRFKFLGAGEVHQLRIESDSSQVSFF